MYMKSFLVAWHVKRAVFKNLRFTNLLTSEYV
jgi:hypothetical protein